METIFKNKDLIIQKDRFVFGGVIVTLIEVEWSASFDLISLLAKVGSYDSPKMLDYIWREYHDRHLELLQEIGE